MDKLIAAFPENIGEALSIASKQTYAKPEMDIHTIFICGMGGSGIGGKLVANLVAEEIEVPIIVHHDYSAPNFINKNTLVIASSYTGNTEETLVCLNEAHQKGAHIIGICSGGELQRFCENNQYDHVIVPGGNPPRTALAYSMIQLLSILTKLNFIDESNLMKVASSKELLLNEQELIHDEAKRLASFIQGTVPVFYAGSKYESIAIRARQQFNENSKMLCWHHVIPEMNHNELVGWGGGDSRFSVVFFNTHDLIRRNQKRMEITLDVIADKTKVHIVNAEGENAIERSIYLIHLIDWASYYAAQEKDVDPIEIEVIDFLKTELANFH